jgi:HrpA-like RNA helicase
VHYKLQHVSFLVLSTLKLWPRYDSSVKFRAETSVTIDGIRFIIDSGKVKELSHDANCNMSKLSEFWISKASAAQRTGRAGRTGPGECFRLYSENEFNHMNEFAVPEIQRAPLEHVVLDIKALELGSPHDYDFIEVNNLRSRGWY